MADNEPLQSKFEFTEQEGGVLYTYANQVNVNWTAHDIRVRFAEISVLPHRELSPTSQTIRVEERVSVAMSWSEAKVLRDSLADAIKGYEALNGEIKPPVGPGA